jgi:AraC-like DNA-binding protein
MSLDGHDLQAAIVATFPMPAGSRFEWHSHTDHQLAWSPEGVLSVVTDAGTYVLPPTRALWIPAGTPHETRASGAAILRSAYLRPARCPITWPDPAPVVVTPLLAELISHLGSDELVPAQRSRAETLLFDLLTPIHTATLDVDLPADPRAREVADALLCDPADNRNLHAWGRQVGASSRTLARAFLADTGLSFGRWRTLIRLRAALPRLADGTPVSVVAGQVGYRTTSAFVAAFRAHTGVTPGRYFRTASR